MSDLYLVLRHRLDQVATEWVQIPTGTMKTARNRKRYSYETMGRLLSVSSKTYERYEKQGRVPIDQIHRLAEALDLEIDQPARQKRIVLPEEVDLTELRDHLDGQHDAVMARLGEIQEQIRVTATTRSETSAPPPVV